jgi:ABC-type transport system substrate-binding protein
MKSLSLLLFFCSSLLAATDPTVLRIARIMDPQTLDPALIFLTEDFYLTPLLYNALLDNTNNTELTTMTARDWSASTDKRVYTLHIRKGQRFSNGREITAADYVYALERYVAPATASPLSDYFNRVAGVDAFRAGKSKHVSGFRAPDAETVVVECEKPDPILPYLLVIPYALPLPREEVEARGAGFATHPIGNGPYQLKEWIRGVRLVFEPNPYFTGPPPRHFDRIEIMIGGDEATHLMMFERGELDIANLASYWIPFPDQRRIMQDPRWNGLIDRAPLPATWGLIMNCEIPPFNNVLVRRAMNHAINRDRWMRVSAGLMAHAEGIIPPLLPEYDPSFRGYDYNPEKARALLAQSGLPLPLRIELWHDTRQFVSTLVLGAQADLKKVGIEADLKMVNYAELITAIQTRGKVPVHFSGWSVGIPDSSDMLGMQFDGNSLTNSSSSNSSYYNNPEVTKLLQEGAAETDLPRRHSIYREAERRIVADAPWVFLGHGMESLLHQPWIKGRIIEPLWPLRLDRIWVERN